jgi:hypothetical protein
MIMDQAGTSNRKTHAHAEEIMGEFSGGETGKPSNQPSAGTPAGGSQPGTGENNYISPTVATIKKTPKDKASSNQPSAERVIKPQDQKTS